MYYLYVVLVFSLASGTPEWRLLGTLRSKKLRVVPPKKVYTALLQRIFKHQWNLIQAFKA